MSDVPLSPVTQGLEECDEVRERGFATGVPSFACVLAAVYTRKMQKYSTLPQKCKCDTLPQIECVCTCTVI